MRKKNRLFLDIVVGGCAPDPTYDGGLGLLIKERSGVRGGPASAYTKMVRPPKRKKPWGTTLKRSKSWDMTA